jgi:hypothetical protein
MGRLAAANVPPIPIFENQDRPFVSGGTITGATRAVTIDQIVAHHGPRQGPVINALRRDTVLVSRDRLASQREMDHWTYFAQRLEDPNHTGMIDEQGIGSFEAISGVALQTALVLPAGQSLPGHAVLEPAALTAASTALAASSVADGRYYVRVRAMSPCGAFAESNEVELPVGLPPLPGAPANLAVLVNGSAVSLNWQAASGTVTGYIIEAGSATGLATLSLGTINTHSVTGVPRGTYYVRVRAINAGGQGPPSSEEIAIVPSP